MFGDVSLFFGKRCNQNSPMYNNLNNSHETECKRGRMSEKRAEMFH